MSVFLLAFSSEAENERHRTQIDDAYDRLCVAVEQVSSAFELRPGVWILSSRAQFEDIQEAITSTMGDLHQADGAPFYTFLAELPRFTSTSLSHGFQDSHAHALKSWLSKTSLTIG
jgi:hypothetical protein